MILVIDVTSGTQPQTNFAPMTKVIWQQAASSSCYSSRRWLHLSDVCVCARPYIRYAQRR